jgi:hypothetical protein
LRRLSARFEALLQKLSVHSELIGALTRMGRLGNPAAVNHSPDLSVIAGKPGRRILLGKAGAHAV